MLVVCCHVKENQLHKKRCGEWLVLHQVLAIEMSNISDLGDSTPDLHVHLSLSTLSIAMAKKGLHIARDIICPNQQYLQAIIDLYPLLRNYDVWGETIVVPKKSK